MKNLFLTFLFSLVMLNAVAQGSGETCHFGISFEISNNPSWGYGEPIVLSVDPNSPAEAAGIQPGDIIMEINGAATYLRNYETINSWLFNGKANYAIFTIRNLSNYFREYELPRKCRSNLSLDEGDLASSFSFYSLEDTQERTFVLPLTITANPKVDYSDYHTFQFIEDKSAPAVDQYVKTQLINALKEKGLTVADKDPDILIQTSYSYKANPKYNPGRAHAYKNTWRFDPVAKKMTLLPILAGEDANAETGGQFVLELGIRFYDKKYVDTEKMTLIWESNIREYLTQQYALEEYVKVHLPLILMQFPYSTNKAGCKYVASFKRYNYTGICYNMDNMKIITDVDRGSPAYNAGIRPGMTVERINDMKFNFSKNDIVNGYKRFLVETMKYRNPNTRFVDANGYPDCMYWNREDYKKIEKALGNVIYAPIFNYLYNFEKYIPSKSDNSLIIETSSKVYSVRPEVKSSVSIRTM